ncbi:putative mitochondrial protein [Sesamum angolense]|uniref:Mitochondrial protein n=1 Tax=Sesamum angolense TaxID=2727404 RepID=A0AAE1W935_9LAMI|nr:putative mitochondrial protein [Sesamum angolense]
MLLSEIEAEDCDLVEQKRLPTEEGESVLDITVSLHAMNGKSNCKTLKVNVIVSDKKILIDCRNTHCFIDEKVARTLGCKLDDTTPCDWLSNYNPVELDFHQQQVTLNQVEGKMVFKTMPSESGTKSITAHSLFNTMRRKKHDTVRELLLNNQITDKNEENPKVVELLQQYGDVFQELVYFHLEEALNTVLSSYQMQFLRNNILTVLLVKKKDGGWRLCTDYRRFIKGYGAISKPLKVLLKKDAFEWNQEYEMAFNQLKKGMTSASVLAMPDFAQPFIFETDAYGKGLELC